MSRLTRPSARLSFSESKAQAPRTQAAGPPTVQGSTPWKAWYKTKAWRDLKQKVHIRDNYTCQRTRVICGGKYPAPDSPVANHKRPHRGNPTLFWDPDNIETVTKAEHDAAIQREEQDSRHTQGTWD